ncbi:MAG: bifunctional DNA primase/polymerase, partial [Candidatus Hatepunaea meridiana]|nr:bifunctional DNA primase/polymerase [Candidatus Hatepunaea meridiana]
ITGSGGRHLYFTYPDGIRLTSGQDRIGPCVDIRADGGYVVAPPSLHRSGRRYEWEASNDPTDGVIVGVVPDWLATLCLNSRSPAPVEVEDIVLSPVKVQELRSALAFINADPYEIWLKVAMALKSTRVGQQAYGIWTEWSMQSEKFEPRNQTRTWQNLAHDGGVSLSTIFWLAKQNGWMELKSGVNTNVQVAKHPEPKTSPVGLDNPPGILGDITRYILETSIRPQRMFAVNAAFALAGTVLGRRFCSETGLRTNLYLISIGQTASGKDHPRKVINKIFNESGLTHLNGGENIASGQGLLTRVEMTPNVLFQLDEFGHMMKSLQGNNVRRYNVEILTNFIKLFSSTNIIYKGTEYADQKSRPRVEILYPCCSIHATTTPETLYEAITSSHVVSGYLNRFIVVDNSRNPRPKQQQRIIRKDVPVKILEWIQEVIHCPGNGHENLPGINSADPLVVSKSKEAIKRFNTLEAEIDKIMKSKEGTGIEALWGRAWEHADKIALICACAEEPSKPLVNESNALWAIKFVSYYTEQLAIEVLARVADSDFERYSKEFISAILNAGDDGLTEYEMGRRKPFTKHPPKDRRIILDSLTLGGFIARIMMKTLGRKREAYVALSQNDM